MAAVVHGSVPLFADPSDSGILIDACQKLFSHHLVTCLVSLNQLDPISVVISSAVYDELFLDKFLV